MLRFYRENARWLLAGLVLALGSSFGQTFFISLFAGQIKVTGDSSKLLQIQPPDPDAPTHPLVRELTHRIDGITR